MNIRSIVALVALLAIAWIAPVAAQLPPEPSGPHPRLFNEPGVAERLRELGATRGTATAGAIANCKRIAGAPAQFARDGYMGLDWARSLQTCLIAWRATGEDRHAQTALIYFRALLDDVTEIGDGKGGDNSARRDSGYAIRALGPYTALAYDWLHDHPQMDEALRAKARQRFDAWTRWYTKSGYRAHDPGNNYHAGYVAAATLMAVAQGSEAGEDGARLWRTVVEDTFANELLPAARDGVLTGGDWGEGWQYAPLSLANYAIAARAVAPYGVDVAALGQWLEDVVLRHVYAMTPTGKRTLVVGDTQSHVPHIHVRRETLEAVALGPAPGRAKSWALAEIERIDDFASDDLGYVLFSALAEATSEPPQAFPRENSGNTFFARGTSILYARTRWDKHAVWFAAFCSSTIDVDHLPPHAGNFVLSRGRDHAIVDPAPYGSLSTLTSNAPTVAASGQPEGYVPSQTFWSVDTGFRWKHTLADGVLLARCDYADQYRFREVASPIKLAYRDFVLLPWTDADGRDSATLLVLDRARTEKPENALHLRFRSRVDLDQIGHGGDAKLRDTRLSVLRLAASGGETEVRRLPAGDCFNDRYTRGNCDASRFAASEVRLLVPGTAASAAFAIEVAPLTGTQPAKPRELVARGGHAWLIERGTQRWVVASADGSEPLVYQLPPGAATHIVLPAKTSGAPKTRIDGGLVLDDCRYAVGGSEGIEVAGAPLVFAVDAQCAPRELPRGEVPSDFEGIKRAGAAAGGTGTKPASPA